MSDENAQSEDSGDDAIAGVAAAEAGRSAKDPIRGIRVWLWVLTGAVGLLTLTLLVAGLYVAIEDPLMLRAGSRYDELRREGDQTKKIDASVRGAFGDALESLEVRKITVTSELSGSGQEGTPAYAVTYRLKGAKASVAGVIPAGSDVLASGLVPTEGQLTSRITLEQQLALSEAWSARSKDPMGAVASYADPVMTAEPNDGTQTLTVAGVEYQIRELWRVGEAITVKGDTFDGDAYSMEEHRDSVFRLDPKAGTFSFVGTEPSSGMSLYY